MTTTPPKDSILSKIRKLLAQVEGTDNQAEAEAFLAKAQELMAYHHVHPEDLTEADGQEQVHVFVPVGALRSVGCLDKISLWCTLCDLNGCKGYQTQNYHERPQKVAAGAGRRVDMELVEELFTHFLLQLERDLTHAVKYKKPEWENGRTYRSNFQTAWCKEVGDRLKRQQREIEAAMRKQQQESDAGTSSDSLSLVLADKQSIAERALRDDFGIRLRATSRRMGRYSGAGRQDGRRDGERADLSGGRRGRMKNRGELTS